MEVFQTTTQCPKMVVDVAVAAAEKVGFVSEFGQRSTLDSQCGQGKSHSLAMVSRKCHCRLKWHTIEKHSNPNVDQTVVVAPNPNFDPDPTVDDLVDFDETGTSHCWNQIRWTWMVN